MPNAPGKKLLWVDDDIDRLSAYVEAIRQRGLGVATARNAEEAIAQCEDFDPDVVLADIRMPPPNGIEIVRRLHSQHPDKIFAVLSSFLYLQRYKDELATLQFPVQLIDKDTPNIYDPTFEDRFIRPIVALFYSGVTYTVHDAVRPNPITEEIDPFSIEFAAFMALPIAEKDRLADRAEQLARRTIDAAFSRGKVWVLMCGDRDEVAATAESLSEIPSDEEILVQAERRNRAPFQFAQPFQSDDQWTVCESNVSCKDYPTLTLSVDGVESTIHFDTGCPFSMFSYEELVGGGHIKPASHFIKETRSGFSPYRCAMVKNLVALVRSQKTGQTLRVFLNGKAIREWKKTSYARTRTIACPHTDAEAAEGLCPFRHALIGRNILTDNGIALTLDGKDKITFFGGE